MLSFIIKVASLRNCPRGILFGSGYLVCKWALKLLMKPTSSKRLTISLPSLQQAASPAVYRRGVQYWRRKKVLKYEESPDGSRIEALVIGSEPQPYKIIVHLDAQDQFKAECSCPYFEEICKHSVSVILNHIARSFPGIKFDIGEFAKEMHEQPAPKAKDLLDDPKETKELDNKAPDDGSFALGVLILERPLALILGTLPPEPQGKVNILKVPEPMLNMLPPESRMYKLVKYLTLLPQATRGPAGGHRIPKGDEGIVLSHLAGCAKLINANDSTPIEYSATPAHPRILLSETENGELSLQIKPFNIDGEPLENPIFFFGQPAWVLSGGRLYQLDISPIHRLFGFFESRGTMTVKLETVPKFLAIDLPILKKRMEVEFDERSAPFPIAVVEPPKVAIRLTEKQSNRNQIISGGEPVPELELVLGFKYGELILPSRDETTAVESEHYTRTISESGQSVWVKRLWEEEGQLRRFLLNMQPTRALADRFFFHDEAAKDALFYLNSQQGDDWEVQGLDQLQYYRIDKEPVHLKALLSLKKDSYSFEFKLQALAENGEDIPFHQVVEAVFRNRAYLRLSDKRFAKLPITTLISLLKTVGASKEPVRPLYQALSIYHALESHGVEVTADTGFNDFLNKLRNFRELPALDLPKIFRGSLREYQREGFNWLNFLREYGLAGILADDMGLGKTIQALALLLSHHKSSKKRQPSLVVAPTSVVYNWLSEAEKFTPDLSTGLFLGRDRGELLQRLKTKAANRPDVIFTTYGIIRRDYETLKEIQFDYVILDEAQNIKNPDSVGAQASKSLKALHRVCLSGTPVENRLKELWSLFDFLMPEFLGSYKEFNEQFERPIEAGLPEGGQKLRKIVHPFVLRRLKSQVEQELPPRTDIIHLCEMDDDQRSLYHEVADECKQKIFAEIASRGLNRSQISVLAALLRLRQVCCDPRLLKDRQGQALPPSAKLSALIAMMREITDQGHKILVFSQFVEMLQLIKLELEKENYRFEYLDGQTPAQERLERVNRFNEDADIPIFLISLKAGGTGLNLTGADYVIHYDPWWNPAVENQATDRAHRIGQTRHVFNYKFITRGSVEEKILALQKKKKELSELVMGGDESIAKELTTEDLEFLFSF